MGDTEYKQTHVGIWHWWLYLLLYSVLCLLGNIRLLTGETVSVADTRKLQTFKLFFFIINKKRNIYSGFFLILILFTTTYIVMYIQGNLL